MNRAVAKTISELLAFCLVVGILGLFAHSLITGLVATNLIAGAVITDLKKSYVPQTTEIQNCRVSVVWGMKKLWRNMTWWRH